MRKVNSIKNVLITVLVTLLYAIWCKDALHEMSAIKMWVILIMFGILVLHLLVWCDREVRRIIKERKRKKHEKNSRSTKEHPTSKR